MAASNRYPEIESVTKDQTEWHHYLNKLKETFELKAKAELIAGNNVQATLREVVAAAEKIKEGDLVDMTHKFVQDRIVELSEEETAVDTTMYLEFVKDAWAKPFQRELADVPSFTNTVAVNMKSLKFKWNQPTVVQKMGDVGTNVSKTLKKSKMIVAPAPFPLMNDAQKKFIPFLTSAWPSALLGLSSGLRLKYEASLKGSFINVFMKKSSNAKLWKTHFLENNFNEFTYQKTFIRSINGTLPKMIAKKTDAEETDHLRQIIKADLHSDDVGRIKGGNIVEIVIVKDQIHESSDSKDDAFGQASFIENASEFEKFIKSSKTHVNRSNEKMHFGKGLTASYGMIDHYETSSIFTRNGQEFVLQTHLNKLAFVHKPDFDELPPRNKRTNKDSMPWGFFVSDDDDDSLVVASSYLYNKKVENETQYVKFKMVKENSFLIVDSNVDESLAENAVLACLCQHNIIESSEFKEKDPTDQEKNALTWTSITTINPNDLTTETKETNLSKLVSFANQKEVRLQTVNQWNITVTEGSIHKAIGALANPTYGIIAKNAETYAERAVSAIAHKFYKTASILIEHNTQVQFKMHLVRSVVKNLRKIFGRNNYAESTEGSPYVLLKQIELPQRHDKKNLLFIQPMLSSGESDDSKKVRIIAGLKQTLNEGIIAMNSQRFAHVDQPGDAKFQAGYRAIVFPSEKEIDDGSSDAAEEESEEENEDDSDGELPEGESAPPDSPKRKKIKKVVKKDVHYDEDLIDTFPKKEGSNPFVRPGGAAWNSIKYLSAAGPAAIFNMQSKLNQIDSVGYAIEKGGMVQPKDAKVFDTSKLAKIQSDDQEFDQDKLDPFEKQLFAPILKELNEEDNTLDIRPEDLVRNQSDTDATAIGTSFKLKLTHWFNQSAFREYAAALQSSLKRARIQAEEEAIDFPDQFQKGNTFQQFALAAVKENHQRIIDVTKYVQLVAYLMVASTLKNSGYHWWHKNAVSLKVSKDPTKVVGFFGATKSRKSVNRSDLRKSVEIHAVGNLLLKLLNQDQSPETVLRSFVMNKAKYIADQETQETLEFANQTAEIFKILIEAKKESYLLLKSSRNAASTQYVGVIEIDKEHQWVYGSNTIDVIAAAFQATDLIVAEKFKTSPYSVAQRLADAFGGWAYTSKLEKQPVAAVIINESETYDKIKTQIQAEKNIVNSKNIFYKIIYNGGNSSIRSIQTEPLITQVTAHLVQNHDETPQLVELADQMAKTPFFYTVQDNVMTLIVQQAAKPSAVITTSNTIAHYIKQNPRKNHQVLAKHLNSVHHSTDFILSEKKFFVNPATLARAFQAAAILQTMAADAGKRFKDPLAKQQSKQTLNQTIVSIVNGF
jgi:hypothetical protein